MTPNVVLLIVKTCYAQHNFRYLLRPFSMQLENILVQVTSNIALCTYQVGFILQCYTEPSRSVQRISNLVTINKPRVMSLSIYCADSEWRREIDLNELSSSVGSRGAPSFSASNLCHACKVGLNLNQELKMLEIYWCTVKQKGLRHMENNLSIDLVILPLFYTLIQVLYIVLSYNQLRMTNSGTFIIAERSRRSDGQCR